MIRPLSGITDNGDCHDPDQRGDQQHALTEPAQRRNGGQRGAQRNHEPRTRLFQCGDDVGDGAASQQPAHADTGTVGRGHHHHHRSGNRPCDRRALNKEVRAIHPGVDVSRRIGPRTDQHVHPPAHHIGAAQRRQEITRGCRPTDDQAGVGVSGLDVSLTAGCSTVDRQPDEPRPPSRRPARVGPHARDLRRRSCGRVIDGPHVAASLSATGPGR